MKLSLLFIKRKRKWLNNLPKNPEERQKTHFLRKTDYQSKNSNTKLKSFDLKKKTDKIDLKEKKSTSKFLKM